MDSVAARAAEERLRVLGDKIRMLADDADPQLLVRALIELRTHRCFRVSTLFVADEELTAESALALKAFWEQGGERWLQSLLRLSHDRIIVTPPSMHRSLSREAHDSQRLSRWLCSIDEPACTAPSRGWRLRANAAMGRRGRQASASQGRPTARECADSSFAAPAARRFSVWRACIATIAPRYDAIPLWQPRPVKRGWLVIKGRRGQHSFCDEVRFYDLASGAAFISQRCSGEATTVVDISNDSTSRSRLRRGHVSVDNVREAAWMLLLKDSVERRRYSSELVYVPAGVDPTVDLSIEIESGGFGCGMNSAGHTSLEWSLVNGVETLANGRISWPTDYDNAAAAHAADLLRVAEAGFTRVGRALEQASARVIRQQP